MLALEEGVGPESSLVEIYLVIEKMPFGFLRSSLTSVKENVQKAT